MGGLLPGGWGAPRIDVHQWTPSELRIDILLQAGARALVAQVTDPGSVLSRVELQSAGKCKCGADAKPLHVIEWPKQLVPSTSSCHSTVKR
jgi:hypothetical protein